MIPTPTLVLLASLYEEMQYAPDPTVTRIRRAKLVFTSECRRLYEAEPPNLRSQMTLEVYIATVIVPDILRHLQSPPPRPSL